MGIDYGNLATVYKENPSGVVLANVTWGLNDLLKKTTISRLPLLWLYRQE